MGDSVFGFVAKEHRNLKESFIWWHLFVVRTWFETNLQIVIFEQNAFCLEVWAFESTWTLGFTNLAELAIKRWHFWYDCAQIVNSRYLDVRKKLENRNFGLAHALISHVVSGSASIVLDWCSRSISWVESTAVAYNLIPLIFQQICVKMILLFRPLNPMWTDDEAANIFLNFYSASCTSLWNSFTWLSWTSCSNDDLRILLVDFCVFLAL